MGERKGVIKYYPPDFDPAKISRQAKNEHEQMKVRMMVPMSIRCNSCGNYIYKGTKFNSRKEEDVGETYLGIKLFRFYFKCTKCSGEIIMKTNPQNCDYVVESGASRNFEAWRAEDEAADEQKRRRRDGEEMGDAMKSLENRTLDSKRQMDILAALDEMKSMKSRHANVSVDAMLEALQRQKEEEVRLVEEDEALIKSIFQGSREFVKRIRDDEDDEDLIEEGSSGKSSSNNKNSSKRKKVSVNPTDHLTKQSSSAVRVSVVKKIAAVASIGSSRHEKENKQGGQKTNIEDSKQQDYASITTNGQHCRL